MRQLAWLRATPKGGKLPRMPVKDAPTLPSITNYEWIISVLDKIGYVSNGYGMTVLPWHEIEAFIRLHFRVVPYWLPGLIRKLSYEYVVQASKSESPDCLEPMLEDKSEDGLKALRNQTETKLRAIF